MKNNGIRILAAAMAAIITIGVVPMRTYAAGNTQQEMSLQGERIYQIMTDRFYDGDLSNNATGDALRYQEVTAEDMRYMKGGDWQGIIDKIPYIKGMGYTAIWISPIMDPQLWSVPDEEGVQGPTAYHGYHIYDPYRASRYFGAENETASKEKLKELVDTCHENGIKVILDVVPNHVGDYLKGTGYDAKYSTATNYKEGTQLEPVAPFNNVSWYHNLGPIDWDREVPHTPESTQMLEDHDLGELDDIDFDNPEAKQAVFDAIKYWFDYTGADAARVDAAKCMKPSDIHELQEYIGVPTFGENFDMNVDFVSNWVGDDAETGMLDFPLFQATVNCFAHGDAFDNTDFSVKKILDQDYLYGDRANEMVTFIDNHDRNRFLTEAGGNVARLQNAITFIYTVRGVPVVFQGTEQNRGNMYDDLMYGMADSWNRWSMVERDANGNVLHDYFNTDTDTYKLIASLNQLKDTYPALSYGTQREMWASSNMYVFSRRIDSGENAGQELICAFNNADMKRTEFVPLRAESSIAPGTVLENVQDSSDRITVSNTGKVAIALNGNSNKIYKVADDQTKTTMPVTFNILGASTDYGQNVYIAGNIPELGNWNVNDAAGAANCRNYPDWTVTLNLPVGTTFEYKVIKSGNGSTEWETCDNRSYTVGADGGAVSLNWSQAGEEKLVPVKFTVNNVTTNFGENIYIVGNVKELGNWNADLAYGPALCPDYPNWTVYIDVPKNKTIEWKAIKKGESVVWQSGNNNTVSTGGEFGTEAVTAW